ncbi:arad-like aldolase/epimerase [Gonapodya prolifera JEL478]|uniref:Arad-like aldolase/epimerase n=1 Tax=Gonapodya prolifera (strain JEL478) TaxID=1344416 RepID=A0A138ZXC3_GONPJ|nr:arad-like aldolase/epimerase [Gonapodya prolifera JEL478]|eukprot:KXS09156.1 arad-like aldolase/epimerase [Gonapodya prolifera JEL478]
MPVSTNLAVSLTPAQRKAAAEKVSSEDGVPIYPMSSLAPWTPPTFRTVDLHRHHVLQRLSASMRTFSRLGFDFGFAGILCARDPEFPDATWVNPLGRNGSDLSPSDFVLINANGETVAGKGTVVIAGWALLAGVLAVLPQRTAIAHFHTPYGRALAARGTPIEPLSQDSCMFYERHVVHERYEGIVDFREGQIVGKSLAAINGHLAILRNHGFVTVGNTVDEMAWWLIAAEEVARTQLVAQAAGHIVPIAAAAATRSRNLLVNPATAAAQFQQYYETVRRGDPEMFEPVWEDAKSSEQ